MLEPMRSIEVRKDEEESRLARLSVGTLRYMHQYGLASERRLVQHFGNLSFLADEERDLLEAMRLNERLNRVTRNIASTGRRNERLGAELLKRQLDGRRGAR